MEVEEPSCYRLVDFDGVGEIGMDPAELRGRLANLEEEVSHLRQRLAPISPASDEWARVGHLVDGLRSELESAEAEAEQIQTVARTETDQIRRQLAADAREILARAEIEAAEKMGESGTLAEPILRSAREHAAQVLDEALQRVRESIDVTGIDLDELSGEFEPAPLANTVLEWLKEADPQAAGHSRSYAEEEVPVAHAEESTPGVPAKINGEGYRLAPMPPEGDFLRYHVHGDFTFASLLALEHAVPRVPGARSVSIAPASEGGAILSLMTADPDETLRKLLNIPDFPLYV